VGRKTSVCQALGSDVPTRDMSKPDLPPCSVGDCKHAAGAIINGVLLCGEHAVAQLEKLQLLRKSDPDYQRERP
jgi:hypothetical protein